MSAGDTIRAALVSSGKTEAEAEQLMKEAAQPKTAAFKKVLAERYPSKEIPRGDLSEIAREFAVSRQYVSAVVKLTGASVIAKSWTCAHCHAPLRTALGHGHYRNAPHFCNYECLGRAKGRDYEWRTIGEAQP